ncbi:mRNA guanylyltransferase [Ranunculus cassubicifolius]
MDFNVGRHVEHQYRDHDQDRYRRPNKRDYPSDEGDHEDRYRRPNKRDYPSEGSDRNVYPQRYQNNKGFQSYEKNKLPDGWLDCPSYGGNVDYIIPSKVPLDDNFDVNGKRYSWREVIQEQGRLKREVGLVIDLTNTTRYYRASDFGKAGINHVKIACKGRGSVPGSQAVNDFIYEILQFYSSKTQSENKYVLVHCTHGFNRTGYMIVHFLVRSQSISVTEALRIFAKARPPGIYKQDYIDELYTIYGERRPESVICPRTPEWKSSSELDRDEDDVGSAFAVNDALECKKMTNDDVIGETVPYDQQELMQRCCYDLLKLDIGTNRNLQFPGSHPVSLNRDNLRLLRRQYYYATWKADGTRYMMLITSDGCYLIDRKFCFRRVRMRFPLKDKVGFDKGTHNFTLLDGEMVVETLKDAQQQVRRYLIYDAIAINGESLVNLHFHERWERLREEVIEPRNVEHKILDRQLYDERRIPYYRYDMEPFSVRRKDFWILSAATKILKTLIPNLSHEADGLIFQGWDDPYVPRTCDGLLKWKYSDSVDFLFEVTEDRREILYLKDGRRRKIVEGQVFFENNSDPSEFSGKIIECTWDPKRRVWVYLRVRTDKFNPNEFNTYTKIMRSINDNITEDFLLNEINQIVSLPMYAERIRKDISARTQPKSSGRHR